MDNKATQSETQKIPKLRFSGFSDDWEEKKLGEAFNFLPTNSLSRSQLIYTDGIIKNIHYGDIHTKFRQGFFIENEKVPYINKNIDNSKTKKESYCQEGDLVIADASEDYKDIGKTIELIDLKSQKIVAGLHTFLLRKKGQNGFAKGFPGYLMKTEVVRKQVMKMATGISVLGISKGNLAKVELSFPTLLEQQKITEFLGATDEWTTNLRAQKESFESYKKGMMQKIFNQEIRFKDDKENNFPKWEEKKLGEICEYKNGGSFENSVVENGKYKLITLNSIDIDGKLKNNHKTVNEVDWFLKKDDLIMVLSDVAHGYFLGLVDIIPENNKYVLNQRMGLLRKNDNYVDLNFLRAYINKQQRYFKLHGQGSSQQNLSKGDILKFKIPVPHLLEQQKIASLLTLIDKVIESKEQQIVLAESWKKGLMQRMLV